MGKAVPRRRTPIGWLDETSVHHTMFALRNVQRQLQFLADTGSNRRETTQLLLTEAHIKEAVSLLDAIRPDASATTDPCDNTEDRKPGSSCTLGLRPPLRG